MRIEKGGEDLHANSMKLMKALLKKWSNERKSGTDLADIGSQKVRNHETYRSFCEELGFQYTGIDLALGKTVDLVVSENGQWSSEVKKQFDVVISGQCLEHVRWPWVWIDQVSSLVKPNGLVIVIAPWQWGEHRHPLDCWRILRDGMRALFEWSNLKVQATGHNERDCFGVAVKK